MKLWLKTTAQACAAIIVLLAAAYPFLRSDPVADAQELAMWQIPSRISALDSADQKKLLARLTYPHHMPKLQSVPDFCRY